MLYIYHMILNSRPQEYPWKETMPTKYEIAIDGAPVVSFTIHVATIHWVGSMIEGGVGVGGLVY